MKKVVYKMRTPDDASELIPWASIQPHETAEVSDHDQAKQRAVLLAMVFQMDVRYQIIETPFFFKVTLEEAKQESLYGVMDDLDQIDTTVVNRDMKSLIVGFRAASRKVVIMLDQLNVKDIADKSLITDVITISDQLCRLSNRADAMLK